MFKKELALFYELIQKSKRVMITATEREDGDSIAAELAVKYIIEKTFPQEKKIIHIINLNPCPDRFRFLHGSEQIVVYGEQRSDPYDVGIVLDCGIDRSGSASPASSVAGTHHPMITACEVPIDTRDVFYARRIVQRTPPISIRAAITSRSRFGMSGRSGTNARGAIFTFST